VVELASFELDGVRIPEKAVDHLSRRFGTVLRKLLNSFFENFGDVNAACSNQ